MACQSTIFAPGVLLDGSELHLHVWFSTPWYPLELEDHTSKLNQKNHFLTSNLFNPKTKMHKPTIFSNNRCRC